MNKDYIILFNCNARNGNPKELDKVLLFAAKNDILYRQIERKEDVKDILHEQKNSGVRFLLILGGDGTIRNLIAEIIKQVEQDFFKLITLGGGTMNAITFKVMGFKPSPYKNLITFIKAHDPQLLNKKRSSQKLKEKSIPALQICQNGTSHHGFYFFLGPIARVINKVYDSKHNVFKAVFVIIVGLFAAILCFPRKYYRLYNKMPLDIYVDGKKFNQKKTLLFCVSIFRKLIWLIEPFKGEKGHRQAFFVSCDISVWSVPLLLPFIARGLWPFIGNPRLHNKPVEKIEVKLSEAEYCNLDGEKRFFEKESLITVTVIKNPINFLVF